jgi:hypothetical protein
MQPYFDPTRFLVCNIASTQQDEIWKMTSTFLEMEDNLNFFENGRQHQFFENGRQQFFFENGRQPRYSCEFKTTSKIKNEQCNLKQNNVMQF